MTETSEVREDEAPQATRESAGPPSISVVHQVANLPVTVAIPAKNEATNLASCLERLGRFAEIVVIDSGSTDATRKIARRFGARVVDFDWNGKYPKKRNWYLTNSPPTQPWVLFLDADEFVDQEFCDALAQATATDDFDGYWITYTNYFMGRRLRYGLPQRKLALFRVGKGLYERIEEHRWSRLDMEVHEHPIIDGTVGEILAPVEHRDDKGIARFLEKHVEYASWEASRYCSLQSATEAWDHLTDRQRFKYRYVGKRWYPMFYFLFTYFLKAGALDGKAGFHYAMYKAWYFRTIRLMINEYTSR